jgi:hypothetical protein
MDGRKMMRNVIKKVINPHKAQILPKIFFTISIIIFLFYGVNNFQSIGSMPCFVKSSFVFEKCLHPIKPAWADKGDG